MRLASVFNTNFNKGTFIRILLLFLRVSHTCGLFVTRVWNNFWHSITNLASKGVFLVSVLTTGHFSVLLIIFLFYYTYGSFAVYTSVSVNILAKEYLYTCHILLGHLGHPFLGHPNLEYFSSCTWFLKDGFSKQFMAIISSSPYVEHSMFFARDYAKRSKIGRWPCKWCDVMANVIELIYSINIWRMRLVKRVRRQTRAKVRARASFNEWHMTWHGVSSSRASRFLPPRGGELSKADVKRMCRDTGMLGYSVLLVMLKDVVAEWRGVAVARATPRRQIVKASEGGKVEAARVVD